MRTAFVSGLAAGGVGTSQFTGSKCGLHLRNGVPQRSLRTARVQTPTMNVAKQDIPWNKVKVVENSVAAEDHRYIVINVGVGATTGTLVDAYRFPGMYVQIKAPGDSSPGFYAISCAPNIQGIFEFLVKESPSSANFCKVKAGDEVEVSPVAGKGFAKQHELAMAKDVLLFATGSGIAPIRAAIESRLNGVFPGGRRSVKLYYGCRYPERMAYQDRFKLWAGDRVEVIPVMSQPKAGWTGRTGYVQDALKADGVADPDGTAALLCGVKGMTTDVREYLTSQGVKDGKIFLNF